MKTKNPTPKRKTPNAAKPPRRLAAAPLFAPILPCSCCGGAGKVQLKGDLLRTFRRLGSKPLLVTALLEDGVTSNAINNRLVALEELHLAVRVGKVGKWVMWCAGEGSATEANDPAQAPTL
jgi:hypothetical protein